MPDIVNPATEEILYSYDYISREALDTKIKKASEAFLIWKKTSAWEKKVLFKKLASIMREQADSLAKINTLEMWMLFSGAQGDISKTATWVDYVADHFEEWLADIEFNEWWISGKRIFEPLGIIYSISPWNFPYNQVFRNAVSNIVAGNVVLSKHASNVVWVARKIEELFLRAGFPQWVYQNIEIASSESEYLIAHKSIKGTNITGWDYAGRKIWELAWKNLKPSILELWGNDPFILLDTHDLDSVVQLAQWGRLSSCGQKCNSAKRFIIVEEYYDEFCSKIVESFKKLTIWDPFEKSIDIWPLAKQSSITELEQLVSNTCQSGGKLLLWGKRVEREWYYFPPTIVADIEPWMDLFHEEAFGPVASIIKAKNSQEAIMLANNSRFWLTATVVTQEKEVFESVATQLETGSVFHNKIPTSYPFLPYGWVKESGYWKELGERGMKNFMNEKVIVY